MNSSRTAMWFFPWCAFVGFVSDGRAAEEPLPPAAAPPAVQTSIRLDKSHLPKIGVEYYPAESRHRGEEGICVVRLEVDSDGIGRASQLVSSSGHELLDEACVAGFTNGQFLPATLDGQAITTWANIPTAWKLSPNSNFHTRRVDDDELAVPIIQKNYQLKVGPADYPDASRTMHQQGDCTIRASVLEDGTVSSVTVSKSTGFATLDQACMVAVHQAPFIPARRNGVATAAFADINISWRLPAQ